MDRKIDIAVYPALRTSTKQTTGEGMTFQHVHQVMLLGLETLISPLATYGLDG
jgi:hypothetical protein